MMATYATRLRKVEASLPTRLTFYDWVMGKPHADQILILQFYWFLYQLREAGIDLHSEEFRKELQPQESICSAICRLLDLDYRCLISHLEEWRKIGE
jgi:hypothetical protein